MLSKEEIKQKQKLSYAKWKENNPESFRASKEKSRTKRLAMGMNAIYQRRYREKYPEKYRASYKGKKYSYLKYIAYKYKVDINEYEKMKELQGGKCAICGEEPKNVLYLDHHHATGQIRELLCVNCNTGIGFLRENSNTMRKMADYIDKYNRLLDISEEVIETK